MRQSVFIAAFLVSIAVATVARPAAVRTVALTGQPVPGAPVGVTFNTFGGHFLSLGVENFRGPVINDAGRVAFRADLSGTGVDIMNNQGIWSEGSGSLALVARTGSAAPGAPEGVDFARNSALELFEPVLNNSGKTAFYGGLSDGTVGLWSEGAGSLALVARDGMQVAGTPEGVNHSFGVLRDFFPDLPYLNDAGQTAFTANLIGSGVDYTNDWGVWSEGSGNLGLVARSGSPAPGTPVGVNFDSFFFQTGFNDSGQTAFNAYLTGSGVDPSNDTGIWSEASGSLALVARGGAPAPGTGDGVNFREFFFPVTLNNMGQTLFSARLVGDGVDETNDEGIWLEEAGTSVLVTRTGSPAPGAPDGVSFGPNLRPNAFLGLNDAGQVAFRGHLTGTGVTTTNDLGIWSGSPDELQLIARTGDQPPGTASGVRFSDLSRPTINNEGQIAFRGTLAGSGVSLSNNLGIWATDQTGVLQLIARSGTQLEVSPGVLRLISDLGFVTDSGNSDGRASGFNDLGQLVFWVRFTNNSQGVFVSDLVASIQQLLGDYNKNGIVDAAEYTVWRDHLGTNFDLNFNGDETGASAGVVDLADYDLWKMHFGETLGSGATAGFPGGVAVPEPSTILLAAIGFGVLMRPARPMRRAVLRPGRGRGRPGSPTLGSLTAERSMILKRLRPTYSLINKSTLAGRRCSAFAVGLVAALLFAPAVASRGAAIEFDANAKSPAVIPFDPDAVSVIYNQYVSGRVPTSVKGPILGGTNINSLVGAETFYNQGYTGTNAVIANIEGGHIWSGHETLTHVQQIQNHPSALNEFDRHATWVGMVLGGRQGGANPGPYQEGLAPDAQLFSGNIVSQWSGVRPNTNYGNVLDAVLYDQYRRAISTGVNGSGRTADVINSSWGGTEGTNGSHRWAIAIDGLINANPHTLFSVAAGNEGPGPDKVRNPAAAYNNISVAALGPNPPYDRPARFSSGGPNDYADPVNGTKNNARQVVDIAAPGENLASAYYGGETGLNGTTDNPAISGPGPSGLPNGPLGGPDFYSRGRLAGTSIAAPTLAGSAALLYDAAYDIFATNDDARDARVMKAVLMNSADKTLGWDNGQAPHPNGLGGVLTTQGLDNRVGTGALNLTTAYDQFLSGTTDVTDILSGNLGVVNDIGWDFGQVVEGVTNDYFFAAPLDAGSMFTATLTWFRDRRINDFNTVFDDSYDDLNLELWSVVDGSIDSLISESSSLYNNSEHFSFALPANGDYALRVRWQSEVFDRIADANQELYGLAWSSVAGLGSVAIPEPSTIALVIAALSAFVLRRRYVRYESDQCSGNSNFRANH